MLFNLRITFMVSFLFSPTNKPNPKFPSKKIKNKYSKNKKHELNLLSTSRDMWKMVREKKKGTQKRKTNNDNKIFLSLSDFLPLKNSTFSL